MVSNWTLTILAPFAPTLGLPGLVLDKEPSSSDPAAKNAPKEIRTSPLFSGSLTPTTFNRDGLVMY